MQSSESLGSKNKFSFQEKLQAFFQGYENYLWCKVWGCYRGGAYVCIATHSWVGEMASLATFFATAPPLLV